LDFIDTRLEQSLDAMHREAIYRSAVGVDFFGRPRSEILNFSFFSVILFAKRWWVEAELRFFVYLVCTAKPAFVDCWDFSVFGKSITYLFSVLLGRSIPSLATKIQ